MTKPSLAETHPEIAKQAHGWNPTTVTAGSGKRMEWKCGAGHVWSAVVASRRKNGCPVCSGRCLVVGLNDLATTHPEIAKQAHGWDPTTVTFGSARKMRWACRRDHVYVATVSDQTKGRGCGVCRGRQINVGFNDLATTNPEMATQADGWDPTTVTFGSNKYFNWKCRLGHRWRAQLKSRTSHNADCPYCANKKVLVGFNDLKTTHPKIAAEAHGWDPSTVTFGSERKRKWDCTRGHVWSAMVMDRTRGYGCAVCHGAQINVGFNDLKTTHPGIAAQAHGWDPTTVTAGSGKKMEWRCELGHLWSIQVCSRTGKKNSGCPYCGNRELLPGFNDLRTRFPEIASMAHGWDPRDVLAKSGRKMEWQCSYGHAWMERVTHRVRGHQHRGCFSMTDEEIRSKPTRYQKPRQSTSLVDNAK